MADTSEQASALYKNIDETIATISPDITPSGLLTFYNNFLGIYNRHPNGATLKAVVYVRTLLEDQGIDPDKVKPDDLPYEPFDLAKALAETPILQRSS